MTEGNYWRSKAFYIHADNFEDLCQKLTEFAKDKFVIAWQIFTTAKLDDLHAVVTYKVQE